MLRIPAVALVTHSTAIFGQFHVYEKKKRNIVFFFQSSLALRKVNLLTCVQLGTMMLKKKMLSN